MSRSIPSLLPTLALAAVLSAGPLVGQCDEVEVAASDLDFDSYLPTSHVPEDMTGQVEITCRGPLGALQTLEIVLSTGLSGTYSQRGMESAGGDVLVYNLYTDPAGLVIWGDGAEGTGTRSVVFSLLLPVETEVVPIYGRIPAQQAVRPGVYEDDIVVDLLF